MVHVRLQDDVADQPARPSSPGHQFRYFDNDAATGGPEAITIPGGQTSYYATDGQGSIVALIANTGGGTVIATYRYDPYGTITAATGSGVAYATNPYNHTSGLLDPATNWARHGTRYNDTTTGRWTTQAPITRLGDPNNANPYTYAADNPRNNTDPSGRYSYGGCLAGYGSFLISVFTFLGAPIVSPAAGVLALYSMTDSCPDVALDSYNTT